MVHTQKFDASCVMPTSKYELKKIKHKLMIVKKHYLQGEIESIAPANQ
jgi:hypothetical protein